MNQTENDGLSKVEEDFSLKEFLQFLLSLPFYLMILVCNTLRLRCSFFKKEKCSVEIIKKEEKEIGVEILLGDSDVGVAAYTFLFHFELEAEKTFIEVDKEVFDSYFEGDQLSLEYLQGLDRLHARLASA